MKNGIQRTPKKGRKPEPGKIDIKKYLFAGAFAFFSALVIQKTFGIEELIGGFLVASALLFILYRDIMRYKPQYTSSSSMLVLLGIIIVGTLALGRVSEYLYMGLSKGIGIETGEAYMFGIPIPAGAMLAVLLLDFHTAIVVALVSSLLTGFWLHDASFSVYAFIGSLTAAFSVIRCKKRTDILKGGLYLFAANVLTSSAILLFGGELLTVKALYAVMYATLSAFFVVALVSLLLPLLESLFKVTTDISLLELLNLEHPLMKTLMVSAPGTYHHSIIVGNLVEAAAEGIGVNPLLGRVCAYFHDIGKIKMPEYFIENLTTGHSKHERLTPHMSSMILTSHVKEGVELAVQYKLPKTVTDIIEQHHGTNLITYFYEKAKGQGGEPLSEDEYRYPGPRPQSKEAALVMMADAVDAASRVLNEPTPSRISALVNKIINHILIEGQLDDCELTLKDINEIKKRFIYILTGVLHKRVDYPGFDFNGLGKDEGSDSKPSKTDKARPQTDKEGLGEGAQTIGAQKV